MEVKSVSVSIRPKEKFENLISEPVPEIGLPLLSLSSMECNRIQSKKF